MLSLAESFEGHDREALRISRLEGHPNSLANRLAAEALAAPIARALASSATSE
jgi:hypothetical protein